ncbi:MAG TPA: hypothetical protein VG457_03115, partial [Planctomycetota bacterium]|nr:hypothetical protein [Planctomycetota bacterium]
MSKELVISSNRHETKVALIEDDLLCEVYFQRANEYSLAGSIHKGRVTRVLPGMQSAFVDLGLERDTFLYVSDFLEEHEDFDKVTPEDRLPREREGRDRDRERRPPQGPPSVAQTVVAPVAESGEATPDLSAVAAPLAGPRPDGRPGDRGDRGGRRSRRRRNNGRGFPDSKYAPIGAERGPAGAEHRASGADVEPETEAEETLEAVLAAPMDEAAPLILPGESLKKYREGAPAAKAPVAVVPEVLLEPDVAEAVEEFNEPIHYPAENALPDAPVHEAAMPEAAPEIPEPVAEVAPPPLPQEYVEAHSASPQIEDEEAEAAEENEGGPVSAPLLDDEEDRDIQAMILGDIEGIDTVDEGGEGQEGLGEEKTGEPGATPESGTASVRERGGRYPHRASRRNRRRRGGPGGGPVGSETGRAEQARPEQARPEQNRPAQSAPEFS